MADKIALTNKQAPDIKKAVDECLIRFAMFNGCETVQI